MSSLSETKAQYISDTNKEISLSGESLIALIHTVVDEKKSFRFKVKGFSMSPFIKDGDIVTVSPLANSSVRIGDSVAFINSYSKKLVIHRVVGKNNDCYLIKGDNVPEIDSFIPRNDILGHVSRVERNGKNIFLGLGPERFMIAFLSLKGVLPLLFRSLRFIPPAIRRLVL